jgi:hypothetical protein
MRIFFSKPAADWYNKETRRTGQFYINSSEVSKLAVDKYALAIEAHSELMKMLSASGSNQKKILKRWKRSVNRRAGWYDKWLELTADLVLIAVEDPLLKLKYHTYQLGTSLVRWLNIYNHLIEGRELGQLSEAQIASAERSAPVLLKAVAYFEQCVRLFLWHQRHRDMSKSASPLPIVGLQLEELQEVVGVLNSCITDTNTENAITFVEQEAALIELQQELGSLPHLLAS